MNEASRPEGLKQDIYILAIETSCDETSVAVVRNGTEVLSNLISSQIDIHKEYGGVVPEVASRKHVEVITVLLDQALEEAGVARQDLTAIAVTYGPGLIGALLVGIAAAKTLSFILGIPLIGVNHIAGHIYANHLVKPLEFPLVALIVSGGHTELVYMEDHLSYELLGETRDDAAGEAFDKVARVLGLPYPGGPNIDRLAASGAATIPLPRARMDNPYDFSFSGLKSAVINVWHNVEQRGEALAPADLAASFQEAVVDVLVAKAGLALADKGARNLIVAGGVAANSRLRAALADEAARLGATLTIPDMELCTDNAAMIGSVGYYYYINNAWSELDLNGIAGLALADEQLIDEELNDEQQLDENPTTERGPTSQLKEPVTPHQQIRQDPTPTDKKALRKRYLAVRDELAPGVRAEKSAVISRKIIESERFRQAQAVALYAAHGSEVDLTAVLEAGLAAGKQMLLPRVECEEKALNFWQVEAGEELVKGHYDLREPGRIGKRPFIIEDIDIILVPGIVFDRQGNRVGYGGGYYDRYLAHGKPFTIGIAYSEQVIDQLPIAIEEHDISLDLILTEGVEIDVN